MAGQIIERGKNIYLIRIYLGRGEDGKRSYLNQTVHGPKKDAQRELTKLLRERDLGTLAQPSRTTLNEYLENWLGSVAKTRVRERTHRDYVWLLKKYIRPTLGERRLDQLRALELQKLYGDLSAQGLSPRTIRYAHTVLRNALEQAVKWGMIARNPADLVQLPRKQQREMNAFSPTEAQRFLKAAREDPWFAVFSLLIDTGLRPGEALALKWSDVDLENRHLSVRRTLTRNAQGWHFAEPKTAGSRRNVPFTSNLQRVLVTNRETQPVNPHTLVFVGDGGEPLHANNLGRRNLPRILKQAGLGEDFRLYDLRHTCATLMLLAGVHPKVVSERLGHASVKITLDTYSHVLPTMQREATEKLGGLLYPEAQEDHVYN